MAEATIPGRLGALLPSVASLTCLVESELVLVGILFKRLKSSARISTFLVVKSPR